MTPNRDTQKRNNGPRINREINARSVHLIDENGQNIGVVPIFQAVQMAEDAGMDLVEMNGDQMPPIVKIMDYGKFKYEQKKKAVEAKKNAKVVEIKELQFRPVIEEHDFQVKMRKLIEFIEDGDKVKVVVRGRFRDMQNKDKVSNVFDRIIADMGDKIIVEQEAKANGRNIGMMIAPSKK